MKRMILPDALRSTRLKASRKFTNLGKLASEVGWKHKELVARLEAKRKVKSEAYYQRSKDTKKLFAKATAEADLSAVSATLKQYGH